MKKGKPVANAAASSKGGFYAALGVVAVLGIAALIFLSRNNAAAVKPLDPNLPPVQAEGYSLGNPNAPVEVLEFADFECPACAVFANVTEPDVRQKLVNEGKIRVRFFDFPINEVHKHSIVASRAAACANEQGKVWEMHDLLFMNQDRWATGATSKPRDFMVGLAKQLGLDEAKFGECIDSGKYDGKILGNRAEATKHQVESTPSFVIGGKLIPGALPYDEFKKYVDEAAAKAPAAPAGPAAPAAKGADSTKKG